ncbi:putative heat shock domain-containing protein [Rhizobium phage RHph_TM39]|uniref:Putative heat shock domain-containing protein n=2 Tax=Cuauhnahuacvirus TaxID=3044696 RepID=A0A7S5RBV6_9CAUD|nr:putative heat shock domain-containing protein [Rhizobium phage RHph_TM30]YP_010671222.1 putative heat shock domain-containing protein [Rhizobium phage RHph_Y65]QIG71546.1 putative heat shock domain-containing protein [Rhizobium phage RHph_TM40]QIG71909.1 putative heat shock domain-containing protein [Rhizobium phage RHph_TM2_3B]QIG72271.1 putative heat shock domain-containing protein [Rhizobium phage RHph_TM3_3_6]QIG77063.1 putative heat shock domain-containing protein [Rhizobium phage RHph
MRKYRKVCEKCNGDGYVSKTDWGYTIATIGMAFLFGAHQDHERCKVCTGNGYIVVEEC